MLDIRMKDENTSWQEWYEENPRLRKYKAGSGLAMGVGVNDLSYVVAIHIEKLSVYKCRYYSTWSKMLDRCHSVKWKNRFPTYIGSSVHESFLRASIFVDWMKSQITTENGEPLQLDKDILYPGNKEYSPNTCAFVPQFPNMSLNVCERAAGGLPKGVRSYILKDGEVRYSYKVNAASGELSKYAFTCKWEAHKAWQLVRAYVIEQAIEKYKLMDCYREDVAYAVKVRADKLRYDAKFGLETTRLA